MWYKSKHNNETSNCKKWERVLKIISLKVVDYYCKGTSTKALLLFLRLSFELFSSYLFAIPICRLLINFKTNSQNWQLLFEWNSTDWNVLLLFIVICAIVTIVYFVCNKYDSKKINDIARKTEETFQVVNHNNDKLQKMEDVQTVMLNLLQKPLNDTINNLLPDIESHIQSLKLKTAYDFLKTIKKEVELNFPKEKALHAAIYFLMGECSRYIAPKRSLDEYKQAYFLMPQNEVEYYSRIVPSMIFVYCKSGEKGKALQLAEQLKCQIPTHPWTWVPTLYFSENENEEVDRIKNECTCFDEVIANLIAINGGNRLNLTEHFATYTINEQLPFTYNNLPVWFFNISIAITRFIQNWQLTSRGLCASTPESEELRKLLSIVTIQINKTDITECIPNIHLCFYFVSYCHDKEKHWIIEMGKVSYTEDFKELFHILYVSMLEDIGEYTKAFTLLADYGGKTPISILNIWLHIAATHSFFPEFTKVLKIASEQTVDIEDEYINYFLLALRVSTETVSQYAKQLHFTNPISQRIYHEIINLFTEHPIDYEYLHSIEPQVNHIFIPYIALSYNQEGKLHEAIQLMEKWISMDQIDIRTFVYIDLLKCDQGQTQKLYHFLRRLRTNTSHNNLQILSLELQLAENIDDYTTAVAITQLICKNTPLTAELLEHRLIALSKDGGHEKEIEKHIPQLSELSFSDNQTQNIFNVYHLAGFTQVALAFLCNQIQKTNSQALQDLLFTISIRDEYSALILQESDVVNENSYILYEENGEEKYNNIPKGSTLEAFIGKKIGDTITRTDLKGFTILRLKNIYNSYCKILHQVINNISNHQSQSIKSLNLNDFPDFTNNPIGFLREISGYTKERQKEYEYKLAQYHRCELSLLFFSENHSPLTSIYNLIFGDFEIHIHPYSFIMQNIKNYDFTNKTFVLDATSAILLHELHQEYGLLIRQQLIVSQRLLSLIEQAIAVQSKGIPSFFKQNTKEHLCFSDEIMEDGVLWKLNQLYIWIKNQCKIEIVEETLNYNFTPSQNPLIGILQDCYSLCQRENHIFISEDWQIISYTPRSLSTYLMISILFPQFKSKFNDYFFKLNYIGIDLNEDFIYEEYKNNHSMKHILACIQGNPFMYKQATSTALKILSGIQMNNSFLIASSLFVKAFKSLKYESATQLLNDLYTKNTDNYIRDCLITAFSQAFPIQLIK